MTEDIQMAETLNGNSASVGTTLDSDFDPANESENYPLLQRF